MGPLDHAGEVSLGLDVGTDAKVARAALNKRVLYDVSMSMMMRTEFFVYLRGLLGSASSPGVGRGRGSFLSSLGRLWSLRKEDVSKVLTT